LKANNYFTASLAWSGDGVESATDNAPATFRAAKDPAIRYATATITLSPKVGYTFQGTTLGYNNFVGAGKPFEYGAPTGGTLIAGTEGDLILTIPYPVVEKVIVGTDFNKENFKKLIGRPIHGNDVVLNGVISGTDYVEDFSPYTAKVEWPADTGPLLYGKFNVADLTLLSPIATVTLIPKEGYKFDGDYSAFVSEISKAVAVDGPDAGGGNLATSDPYSLWFLLGYNSPSPAKILRQITTLEGIGVNEIANFLVSEEAGNALTVTPPSSEIYAVVATVYEGLSGTRYPLDGIVRVRLNIGPNDGYTFKSMTGTTSYFTESETNRAEVIKYLEKVYNGSSVNPDNKPLVTIDPVTGITLLGNGVLVIEAAYKTKPHTIATTWIDTSIGDFPVAIANNVAIPPRLVVTGTESTIFTTSNIVWKAEDSSTHEPVTVGNSFETGNTYTATIIVNPRGGYTFVGSSFSAIEAQLSGAIWGGSSGTNIEGATPDITVTGFVVLPNEDSEDIFDDDKITVTITFEVS
jgi:hypothetical protein